MDKYKILTIIFLFLVFNSNSINASDYNKENSNIALDDKKDNIFMEIHYDVEDIDGGRRTETIEVELYDESENNNIEVENIVVNKIEGINIKVYINYDGSANVEEVRLVNLNKGTENHIVVENLRGSEIKDFEVYEHGSKFQYIDNWDIKASRKNNNNKNSIVSTSNGYKLYWGIGSYGKHEYTLKYTITNFVKQLKDSQVVFWKFVNDGTNMPPENVKLSIYSDNEFSEENEKIWGLGFSGNVIFENGKVVATSNRALSTIDYVTIFIKLPSEMFRTENFTDNNYEEIRSIAFDGVDYDKVAYGEIVYSDKSYKNKKKFSLKNKFDEIKYSILMFSLFIIVLMVKKTKSRN